MKKVGVILILGLILLFGTVVVFAEGTISTGTDQNVQFVDAGTNPNSALYFFDRFTEKVQIALTANPEAKAQLEAKFTAERLSEIHVMIQEGNYAAAEKATIEAKNILNSAGTHVGELKSSTKDLTGLQEDGKNIIGLQKEFIDNSRYVDSIKDSLKEKIDKGEITQDQAARITNEIQTGTAGLQKDIADKKDELIESAAKGGNVPIQEAKIAVENEEEKQGITEDYKKEVNQKNIDTLSASIVQIEKDVAIAVKDGRKEEANAMNTLLENAKLKLQISQDALDRGDYGKAFGQFNAAEHLTLNADKLTSKKFSDLTDDEKKLINENLGKDAQKTIEEQGNQNKKFADDYEKYKEELLSKYPEKREEFEKQFELARRVSELGDKLKTDYPKEIDKLKSDGKSEEEAAKILSERYNDEYRKAYGEDYIPPGFVKDDSSVTRIDADTKIDSAKVGGGFVEGQEYTDPATGYQYEFSKDSYNYVTPSGEKYDQKYPEGYKPETYTRGDEVHNYKQDTPQGTYEYKYSTTGYEVVNPDGTSEKYAYPQGKYDVVGGGEINQKATGFEYKTSDGKSVNYDYNPQFKNYVASDGKVYAPDVSAHEEKTQYEGNKKVYSYSYGADTWNYDPSSNKWTSSSGQTYTPSATTGAPIGHEDQKEYKTETGVIWNYDSTSGAWKSSDGKSYTPPPSSYYSYDSQKGQYVDAKGNTYSKEDYSQRGGVSDASGKTWNYDSSAGKWTSSTGESYNPYSGTTTTSGGQTTTNYNSGGYQYSPSGTYSSETGASGTAKDSFGNTWTKKSDGSWSSQGGGTQPGVGAGSGGSSYSYNFGCANGACGGGYYSNSPGEYAPSGGSGGSGPNAYGSPAVSGGSPSGGSYSGGSYSGSSGYSGGSSGGGSSGGTGMTISGFSIKDIEKYRLF